MYKILCVKHVPFANLLVWLYWFTILWHGWWSDFICTLRYLTSISGELFLGGGALFMFWRRTVLCSSDVRLFLFETASQCLLFRTCCSFTRDLVNQFTQLNNLTFILWVHQPAYKYGIRLHRCGYMVLLKYSVSPFLDISDVWYNHLSIVLFNTVLATFFPHLLFCYFLKWPGWIATHSQSLFQMVFFQYCFTSV